MIDQIKKRAHTAGIAAAGVSIAGAAAALHQSLQSCNAFESKFPFLMMALGIVAQSVTKGVHQGGTDVVDREESQA